VALRASGAALLISDCGLCGRGQALLADTLQSHTGCLLLC